VSPSTPATASRLIDPPPPLTFDPLQNVGHNRKLKAFVETQINSGGFETKNDFPVDQEGGGLCVLSMQAAKNSQYIPRKYDGNANGYVVAVITNPSDCKPKRFPLGKNDRAAWIVRFDTPNEYADRRLVGAAYLVSLQSGVFGDDNWFSTWTFWQCGSQHPGVPQTASAVIANEAKAGDICQTAYPAESAVPDHDAKRVSRERMAKYKARLPLESGDPGVWFACGTDCCYSELRS
jgi:hypothetical protein